MDPDESKAMSIERTITCSNCNRPLDLAEGPCPDCGSTARTHNLQVNDTISVSADFPLVELQRLRTLRNRYWLLLAVALTLAGVFLPDFYDRPWSWILGGSFAVIAAYASYNGITKQREIHRYEKR